MPLQRGRQLNPRKLLLSKWTAALPKNKEKHFIVVRVLEPAVPGAAPEYLEIEAVYSQRRFVLHWSELVRPEQWLQGWQ